MLNIVYFKVTGHQYVKYGPCLPSHTEDTLKPVLAKAFEVDIDGITILEIYPKHT